MNALTAVACVLLALAFIIGVAILAHRAARRRREALAALATKLGLTLYPEPDRGLAKRLQFLDRLAHGANRYVFNRLSGSWRGHDVMAFEFHYETYSHTPKGGTQTHHHYFTAFVLLLPRTFPELLISPEGLWSRFAQALGYEDIDFESAEFSRAFCVRSPDKKFAYDVCHPRMMEYLLAHRDLTIEIEHNALALVFESRLDVPRIESRLHQLIELRHLLPGYLFSQASS